MDASMNATMPASGVGDVCREQGISDATYYCWKAQNGGLEVSELRRHGGAEMHIAGDSFFATFDDPLRALRCAQALVPALSDELVETSLCMDDISRR